MMFMNIQIAQIVYFLLLYQILQWCLLFSFLSHEFMKSLQEVDIKISLWWRMKFIKKRNYLIVKYLSKSMFQYLVVIFMLTEQMNDPKTNWWKLYENFQLNKKLFSICVGERCRILTALIIRKTTKSISKLLHAAVHSLYFNDLSLKYFEYLASRKKCKKASS